MTKENTNMKIDDETILFACAARVSVRVATEIRERLDRTLAGRFQWNETVRGALAGAPAWARVVGRDEAKVTP